MDVGELADRGNRSPVQDLCSSEWNCDLQHLMDRPVEPRNFLVGQRRDWLLGVQLGNPQALVGVNVA